MATEDEHGLVSDVPAALGTTHELRTPGEAGIVNTLHQGRRENERSSLPYHEVSWISPARERRGSRHPRRSSTDAADLVVDCAGCLEAFPVIETEEVEVEHGDGGSVCKVNEYIIVRDLGAGSTADVKLCRLVPTNHAVSDKETVSSRASAQDAVDTHVDLEMEERNDPDLYAVKIFDRQALKKCKARFKRPSQDRSEPKTKGAIPEALEQVQQEVAIMKKLVHPNVVHLVEVIDSPAYRSLYLVMEYVSRGPVMHQDGEEGRYVSPQTGGSLDAGTAAKYFLDILDGLEYLHMHHIAHRDLKPENVLIGDNDRAKIADFGVSHHFQDEESRTPKTARSLARSGSRAQTAITEGTWCFWAPEMCGYKNDSGGVGDSGPNSSHNPFNAYAADVWAVGVTLWCLLFGAVPFFRVGPMDLFNAITQDPLYFPPEAKDDERARDLLQRMLEKDPGRRLSIPEARGHLWVGATCRPLAPVGLAPAEMVAVTEDDVRGAVVLTEQAVLGVSKCFEL